MTRSRHERTDALMHPLRQQLEGALLEPGDSGYDQARAVWNARFDRRPAAIARCAAPADVQAAVRSARDAGLSIAVKGGGHDFAGHGVCDEGLVIDLSPMAGVSVDRDKRTARVQAGATWGAFDRAAQVYGLATPGPTVSTVGVAGSTLGGGTGYLSRRHGLALDNLLSADVVVASGERLHASENEHADLFWALRGGGGNFGIVTAFEFRLHPVGPEILAGQHVYRLEEADDVLKFYRDFMASAPDEVQCYAVVFRVPPLPAFPQDLHGELAIDLVAAHTGTLASGDGALAPIREFGKPSLGAIGATPYTSVQQMFDAGSPSGHRWYTKAQYLQGISDDLIEVVLRQAKSFAGSLSIVYFEPLGGAGGRVSPTATAFPHRTPAYSFHILAGWSDAKEDGTVMEWARGFHDAVSPHAAGGVYVNQLDVDEPDRVPAAYGVNYDRLRALKAAYDPGNLFRMNQNIEPGAEQKAAT